MTNNIRFDTRWLASGLAIALLLAAPSPAAAVPASQAVGGMFAASDGHGTVMLEWYPPMGRRPAGGWRISSGSSDYGRATAESAQAMRSLSTTDANFVANVDAEIAKATRPADLQNAYGVLGLAAFTKPALARALGLAITLSDVPGGARSYRAEGLDASGRPSGVVLESPPVDSRVMTPLPPTPTGLRGDAVEGGVELYWLPPPVDHMRPVIGYLLERNGLAVNSTPLVTGATWNVKRPAYVDRSATLDQQLAYKVVAVDLFGRKSEPASASFFAADILATRPLLVWSTTSGTTVTLRWTPRADPHAAGYVVDRSAQYAGVYQVLTTSALPPRTGTYADTSVHGGTAYYYRVHIVSPQGDIGPPSIPVLGAPVGAAPPQVRGLRATAGRTRVELTWEPVSVRVAGYFVERHAGSESVWTTMNPRVTPLTKFDDYVGESAGGSLHYRVIAVGYDSRESTPSAEVSAVLPDLVAPGIPYIESTSGAGGRATLTFSPASPASRTVSFLVVRGGSSRDPGLVIGTPLDGRSRLFVDTNVRAGEDYFYKLVAVGSNGLRSSPTRAVVVRVGNPAVPAATRPSVKFIAKPFPRIELTFAKPPSGFSTYVEVKRGLKTPWMAVAGPIVGLGSATDANPQPHTKAQYRIVYAAANGAEGTPSAPITVSVP
jgi:hypothetical protein